MLWRLRSILFTLGFFGVTAVMMFICIPVLLTPPHIQRKVPAMWVGTVYWLEKYVLGLDYVVLGKENLPPPPYIVGMKHQSAWETMKLYALFGYPAIILKKELMRIPVWGSYAKVMEMIPIDRSKGREATAIMIEHAKQILVTKRPLVIFPQGTRVGVGMKKPYKSGAIRLYKELNIPLVPVAHNAGVFWPRLSFWKRPGIVTIEILPPIAPGQNPEQVQLKLEEMLESASDRLAAQVIHEEKWEKYFPPLPPDAYV